MSRPFSMQRRLSVPSPPPQDDIDALFALAADPQTTQTLPSSRGAPQETLRGYPEGSSSSQRLTSSWAVSDLNGSRKAPSNAPVAADVSAASAVLTMANADLVFETLRHLRAVGRRKAAAAAETEVSLRRALLWSKSSEWIAEHVALTSRAEAELSQLHAQAHAVAAASAMRHVVRARERMKAIVEEASKASVAALSKREEEFTQASKGHSILISQLEKELTATTTELAALREHSTKAIAAKNSALATLHEQLVERDQHLGDLQRRHMLLVRRLTQSDGASTNVSFDESQIRALDPVGPAPRGPSEVPQPMANSYAAVRGASTRSRSLGGVISSLPPELLRLLNAELAT